MWNRGRRMFEGGRPLIVLLGALVLVAMIAAACGGDEDPTAVPTIAAAQPPAGAPTSAPAAVVAEPTKAMVATTAAIPGTVLKMAMESIGKTVIETKSDPMDGCRPGCLLIKDDFFLMTRWVRWWVMS